MSKIIAFSLLLVSLYCIPVCHACGRGAISIKENKYENILVAISESVPEDYQIVERLKIILSDTSKLLFDATRRRAFFGSVTILVPESWSSQAEYEQLTDETVDTSDIQVDTPDTGSADPNRPFTIQTLPCGNPGEYIRITTDYVTKQVVADKYGPYNKVMVHEWAHLRYGVFNEYPSEQGPHFYAASDGNIKATKCSLNLEGELYNLKNKQCQVVNGLIDADCRWRDTSMNVLNGKHYASLMYSTKLDHVAEFCDSSIYNPELLHDREAPTDQNRQCEGKSVWEVMGTNEDFANDLNPPLDEADYTEPTFKVVQSKIKRTVLVLDKSGSMDKGPIVRQRQACANYIATIVEDGEKVGIVSFDTKGYTLANMTAITTSSRTTLIDKLPAVALSGTSIGNGIMEGIKVLNAGEGCVGATMILVSDGKNTNNPDIDGVRAEVKKCQMKVHTIAFTSNADKDMDSLAADTGGLSFFFPDNAQSNALNEAFEKIGSLNIDTMKQSYTLISESLEMSQNAMKEGNVTVDSSLGVETDFTFNYGISIDVFLTSPSGKQYDNATTPDVCTKDDSTMTIRCIFKTIPEYGVWKYSVKALADKPEDKQRVAITIKSKPDQKSGQPIIARSSWAFKEIGPVDATDPQSYMRKQILVASVSRGSVPVVNANVVATVSYTDTKVTSTIELSLLDNGAGADLTRDDGIYSAYFVKYEAGYMNARYGVTVKVNNQATSTYSPGHILGQGVYLPLPDMALPSHESSHDAMYADVTEDFQRVTSGGVFTVTTNTNVAFPPGRITDVQVISVNTNTSTIALIFTAQGAVLDGDGPASGYVIMQGKTYESVTNSSSPEYSNVTIEQEEVTHGNLSNPALPNTKEEFTFKIKNPESVTYYYAILAIYKGVPSDQSNIVSATLRPIDIPSTDGDGGGLSGGAVAGIVISVIIVILLICAALWYFKFK